MVRLAIRNESADINPNSTAMSIIRGSNWRQLKSACLGFWSASRPNPHWYAKVATLPRGPSLSVGSITSRRSDRNFPGRPRRQPQFVARPWFLNLLSGHSPDPPAAPSPTKPFSILRERSRWRKTAPASQAEATGEVTESTTPQIRRMVGTPPRWPGAAHVAG
jgi:hypothetical protein